MDKILVGEFVKRQVKGSGFSYFNGTWKAFEQEVLKWAEKCIKFKNGYRDGVKLLPLSFEQYSPFMSAVVEMNNKMDIKYEWKARREGEEKVLKRVVYGKCVPAKFVDIVLYHKSVLIEDKEYIELDKDNYWEVISINCRLTEKEHPIPPMTMARNQLTGKEGGKGGSKANYSGDEFAESIRFWNNHVLVTEI